MEKKKYTQEQIDSLYWRYKKKEPPKDEFADRNGEVKVTLQAFKCSKCDYVATNRVDFNEHWSLEH